VLCLIGTFTFAGLTVAVLSKFQSPKVQPAGINGNVNSIDSRPLDPAAYARGQKLYASSCITCHGATATGVPRLGKDLVRSRLLVRGSDDELVQFIKTGRAATDPANTTGIPMPPKGNNPALSDNDIADIVTYLRGLQHPLRIAADQLPVETVAAPTQPEPVTSAPAVTTQAAAGPVASGASDADAIARGKKVYVSCMACHGKDALGVKGMGKDLVHSSFVLSKTDDQLLDFIKKGRGPTDPDNTTKVGMPPKGGNPALNDKQLRDLIAYLRSLQTPAQK
jgi:disulfide bond formation protein DsbB